MNLKRKLGKGSMTLGSWITLGDYAGTEIMAKAGFDWLAIDMEHSAIEMERAQNLVRIIELSGCVPLVRVSENNANIIKRVMDAGSHGVIVPMVNSAQDALHAVNAVKYPPRGIRGVGLGRAQRYGLNFEGYKRWQAKNSVVIVQIEHIDAVNNLGEILEVDGVDGFFVGPYDLSASLGRPGEFSHPDVKKALDKIRAISKDANKVRGIHVIQPDHVDVDRRIKEGYNFIAFSLDALFLGGAVIEKLSKIRRRR
ncbi:MAG: 2,4-dihydroxyhept-2-ene-1,7-dioic acid aldolase [Omnitrophica bacterium RIFCSPHIGHO2_02_FULL_46_20]|nr:MAG: 2,4-dihydroxyhept-2-ene-1,7-dioic acid aldolase [Omnitrophica bacterium RIFCSPHIGHO2_02_FULL_46_20]